MNDAQHNVGRPRNPIIIVGACLILLVLVFATVVAVVRLTHVGPTKAGTVQVTTRHRERKIQVEQYSTFTRSAWLLPARSRTLGTQRKVRSYTTIHDGWRTERYTDSVTKYRDETYSTVETRYRTEVYTYSCSSTSYSNGKSTTVFRTCTGTRSAPYSVPVTKTRSVAYQVPASKTRRVEITHQKPLYATWYTYQVNDWATDRWLIASDATSIVVTWPSTAGIRQNAQSGTQLGEERLGSIRTASYTLDYIDQKHTAYSLQSSSMRLWDRLTPGTNVAALYDATSNQLVSMNWRSIRS